MVSLKAVKPELDSRRSRMCAHRRNTVGHQDWVKHQYCSCPGYKICFLLFLLNNDVLFNTHSQFDHVSFILWSNTNKQQVDSLQLGSILSTETWTTLLLRPSAVVSNSRIRVSVSVHNMWPWLFPPILYCYLLLLLIHVNAEQQWSTCPGQVHCALGLCVCCTHAEMFGLPGELVWHWVMQI